MLITEVLNACPLLRLRISEQRTPHVAGELGRSAKSLTKVWIESRGMAEATTPLEI